MLSRVIQESPAIADKPARRENMPKIAQIRRAYNVVADNTGLLPHTVTSRDPQLCSEAHSTFGGNVTSSIT